MTVRKHLLLFTGLTLFRLLTGCYSTVVAISMPTLANNVDKEVAATSWIFSFRNVGIFIGGILGNIAIKRLNPIVSLVGASVLCGLILSGIPYITNFFLLNIAILMLGFVNGFVDSVGQIILISNFVPEVAARLLGTFHLLFNLGAVAGSAIMNRFIEVERERPCPGKPEDIPSSRALLPSEDFSLTYIIPALICIPTAFLLYLVYHCRVYEKLQAEKVARMSKIELEQENKPPERVKPFIGLYLVVLFAIASIQQMTVAYVHQYSRCDEHINATSTESANNMIYFWIFNSLGRVSVVVLVGILSIQTFFALDCIGMLTALIVLSIKPIITKSVYFGVINLLAFFIGPACPISTIYGASIFRIEKSHMWILYVGYQLLPIISPIICGNWMEVNLDGFVYFNLASAGLATIFLPLLYYYGKKCRDTDIPNEDLRFAVVSGSVLTCKSQSSQ